MFFFFQAEDGIRDGHVTGVQTCALPIFSFASVSEANERSTSSPGLPIAASTCRCISAASFSRKSRSVAISVQEWVVNFVCYSLLILCPRFVQIIHRGIQTHKVGEGGRTAGVKG